MSSCFSKHMGGIDRFPSQSTDHSPMSFERALSRQVAVKNISDSSRWNFHQAIHLCPTKVGSCRVRDPCLSRSAGVRRPRANEPAPTRLPWTGCGPDIGSAPATFGRVVPVSVRARGARLLAGARHGGLGRGRWRGEAMPR